MTIIAWFFKSNCI